MLAQVTGMYPNILFHYLIIQESKHFTISVAAYFFPAFILSQK
jgi:hypothetical protein